MNNIKFLTTLSFAIGLFCTLIMSANANTNSQAEQQNNQGQATTVPQVPATHVCPAPNSLAVNNLRWYGPNGWKMYTPTFVTQVTLFTGAHWIGVGIGQVLCTYIGLPKLTFPISLSNPMYIKEPNGYKWGKEINGVKNCLSNNVYDCVFEPTSVGNGNVNFEQLDNLKKTAPIQ